jgi:hypothetical protein
LLHRTNAGVRQDFAFDDEKRWATLYGVLETERARRRDEVPDEDGETGNRRYANQAKEKPGISPAIVNRLLGNTVFLSLKDLGLALPPYAEEVVRLEMEEEQMNSTAACRATCAHWPSGPPPAVYLVAVVWPARIPASVTRR